MALKRQFTPENKGVLSANNKDVVEQQFAAARRAKSDEECMACIKNLRAETKNLEEQGRMLRMKTAKLYAKVEFIRENNKIVGYVISAVNVMLSGV
jgi:ribosomal protein L19E